MTAPKLLDKRTVSTQVQTQLAQQAKAGVALAKKVDVVRETLLEEQARLDEFRRFSLSALQQELTERAQQRDTLAATILAQQEEVRRLQEPLDAEWDKVRKEAATLDERARHLTAWERSINERDSAARKFEEENSAREIELARREQETSSNWVDADEKKREAHILLENAHVSASKIQQDAQRLKREVLQREVDADDRAIALRNRERNIQDKEQDIALRERRLQDRYAVLQRTLSRLNK